MFVPTRKMVLLFGWGVCVGETPVLNQPWNVIEIAICIIKVNGTIHLSYVEILVEDLNPWIEKYGCSKWK